MIILPGHHHQKLVRVYDVKVMLAFRLYHILSFTPLRLHGILAPCPLYIFIEWHFFLKRLFGFSLLKLLHCTSLNYCGMTFLNGSNLMTLPGNNRQSFHFGIL